jgi:hypothetical protein
VSDPVMWLGAHPVRLVADDHQPQRQLDHHHPPIVVPQIRMTPGAVAVTAPETVEFSMSSSAPRGTTTLPVITAPESQVTPSPTQTLTTPVSPAGDFV